MNDKPTSFEFETAMAVWYFYQKKCDVVILEVGMGGRLDATNISDTPVLSVITDVALDHMVTWEIRFQKFLLKKPEL